MPTRYPHDNRWVQFEFSRLMNRMNEMQRSLQYLSRIEGLMAAGDGIAMTSVATTGKATLSTHSRLFFTDAAGSGTVIKTWVSGTSPAQKILSALESDDDDITLTIEIHAATDDWGPDSVAVSGGGATEVTIEQVSWTQVGTSRIWTASVNLTDAGDSGIITAVLNDGSTATLTYTRSLNPPSILTAVIDPHPTNTGGDAHCPYAQTQVSAADTLAISGTAESHAEEVYVKDYEVTTGEGLQGPFAVVAGVWSGTINCGTGNNATANYQCYAKVTGGTAGADFISTESVDLNQTTPNLALSGILYPGAQGALKNDENARVTVTDSNRDTDDTYVWDDNSTGDFDDGGDMAIANSEALVDAGTYDNTSWNGGVKWVERQAGTYRETTNVRITATRTAKNGLAATLNITVEIAHVVPTITITNNGEGTGTPKRFRSRAVGGDKTYTITITSNQKLGSAPSLSRDAADDGPALGAFAGSNKVWTATLTCQEDDTKNVAGASHDFTSLVATNKAGLVQNTIGSGSAYMVAGFEQRDVAMARFEQYNPIGTMVSNRDNPNKITCSIPETGITLTYVGSVTPTADGYTITDAAGAFDADGNRVRCLDADVYDNIDYTLRIQENA